MKKIKQKSGLWGRAFGLSGRAGLRARERPGLGRAVDGGGSVHPGPDIPGRAKNRAGRRPGRVGPARLTPLPLALNTIQHVS